MDCIIKGQERDKKMKFKDLANGMVFRYKSDEAVGANWWYTKIDDLDVICVGSHDGAYGAYEAIGHRYSINEELQEEEVVLATIFRS